MDKAQIKKWSLRAAKFGAALGLVCHYLPHDYQVVCVAVAKVCTLGL